MKGSQNYTYIKFWILKQNTNYIYGRFKTNNKLLTIVK